MELVSEGLLDSVVRGDCASILLLGARSTGKTESMDGASGNIQCGLIPSIIKLLISRSQGSIFHISYLETSGSKLIDLLVKPPDDLADIPIHPVLRTLESGSDHIVSGLSRMRVHSVDEALSLHASGCARKSPNAHSIFTIFLESTDGDDRVVRRHVDFTIICGASREENTANNADALFLETLIKDSVVNRNSKITRLVSSQIKRKTCVVIGCINGENAGDMESISTLTLLAHCKRVTPVDSIRKIDPVSDQTEVIRMQQEEIDSLKVRLRSAVMAPEPVVVDPPMDTPQDHMLQPPPMVNLNAEPSVDELSQLLREFVGIDARAGQFQQELDGYVANAIGVKGALDRHHQRGGEIEVEMRAVRQSLLERGRRPPSGKSRKTLEPQPASEDTLIALRTEYDAIVAICRDLVEQFESIEASAAACKSQLIEIFRIWNDNRLNAVLFSLACL